jgi:hypothetical protein
LRYKNELEIEKKKRNEIIVDFRIKNNWKKGKEKRIRKERVDE